MIEGSPHLFIPGNSRVQAEAVSTFMKDRLSGPSEFTDDEFAAVEKEFNGLLTKLINESVTTLKRCGLTKASPTARGWVSSLAKCTVPQRDNEGKPRTFETLRDFTVYVHDLVTSATK